MKASLLTVQIRYERDVVLSRQRARRVASVLGFDGQDQVRISTTISELARNVYQYAKKGKIDFACEDTTGDLHIEVSDQGPGILNLSAILAGEYVSKTGMGVGLTGAKRLMDFFHAETQLGKGTQITVGKKRLPATSLSQKQIESVRSALAQNTGEDPFQEIQRQNQELLMAMEELRRRQDELDQLNRELEHTNRGVVALYAELDEQADYLRRASELKSRFLSNMTHEFRTPLNSILGLSRMLLERVDGELTFDQEKQVSYISRAATDLSELVNDLLDLSKVEAGKITLRPTEFSITDLFGALRGMLRPLLSHNSSINLIFEEITGIPPIFTDESKLSQILRNFIANAIKYTEKGEVRVKAFFREDKTIVISVSDTGIGIAPEDLSRIFEEFTQVEGPHQKKSKGTGLGLSLSKRLAEILGGSVTVSSKLGEGSTFSLIMPLSYRGQTEITYMSEMVGPADRSRAPVLVLDDNTETLFIYESYLKGTRFQAIPVRSIKEAKEFLRKFRPLAIILDILLEHENSWSFLLELKQGKETQDIPVFVITMVDNEFKALRSGANEFHLKPVEKQWLIEKLTSLNPAFIERKLLLVDDDEVSRYLFRGLLGDTSFQLLEASGGHDGFRMAIEKRPDVIFLDLDMPDLKGMDVLERLRAHPQGQTIPVILYSSNSLAEEILKSYPAVIGVLSKDLSSREVSRAKLSDLMAKVAIFR